MLAYSISITIEHCLFKQGFPFDQFFKILFTTASSSLEATYQGYTFNFNLRDALWSSIPFA